MTKPQQKQSVHYKTTARRASATNTDTTLTRAPNEEAPNGCQQT